MIHPERPPDAAGHFVANWRFVANFEKLNRTGIEFRSRSFIADPYGQPVAKASTDREEILCHDLDFSAVEDFRRIDAYGDLTKRWRS